MYRKDSVAIDGWLKKSNKALLVTGARQTGKTWLIRDEIKSNLACVLGSIPIIVGGCHMYIYLYIDVAMCLMALVEILRITLIIIEKCKRH